MLRKPRRGCGDSTVTVQALAIQRLGQNARHRGLAHATCAREQIGMVQALLGQRIGQSLNHVLLPTISVKVRGRYLRASTK
jgi:hypothetical protein